MAGEPKPEGKDAEERLKKLNARLPAEKALAGYVLLLPKSKLDDIFKKRAELLEKKEAKKATKKAAKKAKAEKKAAAASDKK